ncbi:GNAT family N-acetyltransferase [Wenxinia marina]|uniref:Wenxma_17, whole genome shotgun sequence n=1 Tax=Wenxinia marina DSM 24838 TaxID=1123501 RepID=A0A0D0P8V0_9RHOB|nr:GNAT family N-acetyltransferase [Wenxinia marina]KIQ68001.1 Acetyltransferase [Wenxinia marina DSM 24838]GGL75481.1 acetyltransferase [Wenxinia marina]
MIPTIRTPRLTLGPFEMDHFEAFATFVKGERSRFLGGPADDPRDAWDSCMMHNGQWLARPAGAFWVREGTDGVPVGRTGLWWPIDREEPELSWVVYDGFEGRGYAHEAVSAARDWMMRRGGLTRLVSYIAPENVRSRRLAERLGAVIERRIEYPNRPPVDLWRHPEAA